VCFSVGRRTSPPVIVLAWVWQVSLGRNAGTGHLGRWVPFSFMVAAIKSKTLFVPKTRKDLGLSA
jgi:hypothetical protein